MGIIPYNATDLVIGAKTLWAEARGEPVEGQIAVAHVIVTRCLDSEWSRVWIEKTASIDNAFLPLGSSLVGCEGAILNVCRQPWQFSCWNTAQGDGSQLALMNELQPQEYQAQTSILTEVLEGHAPDPVDGAQFYFASYIDKPDWASEMTFVKQIGRHLFYRQ